MKNRVDFFSIPHILGRPAWIIERDGKKKMEIVTPTHLTASIDINPRFRNSYFTKFQTPFPNWMSENVRNIVMWFLNNNKKIDTTEEKKCLFSYGFTQNSPKISFEDVLANDNLLPMSKLLDYEITYERITKGDCVSKWIQNVCTSRCKNQLKKDLGCKDNDADKLKFKNQYNLHFRNPDNHRWYQSQTNSKITVKLMKRTMIISKMKKPKKYKLDECLEYRGLDMMGLDMMGLGLEEVNSVIDTGMGDNVMQDEGEAEDGDENEQTIGKKRSRDTEPSTENTLVIENKATKIRKIVLSKINITYNNVTVNPFDKNKYGSDTQRISISKYEGKPDNNSISNRLLYVIKSAVNKSWNDKNFVKKTKEDMKTGVTYAIELNTSDVIKHTTKHDPLYSYINPNSSERVIPISVMIIILRTKFIEICALATDPVLQNKIKFEGSEDMLIEHVKTLSRERKVPIMLYSDTNKSNNGFYKDNNFIKFVGNDKVGDGYHDIINTDCILSEGMDTVNGLLFDDTAKLVVNYQNEIQEIQHPLYYWYPELDDGDVITNKIKI